MRRGKHIVWSDCCSTPRTSASSALGGWFVRGVIEDVSNFSKRLALTPRNVHDFPNIRQRFQPFHLGYHSFCCFSV